MGLQLITPAADGTPVSLTDVKAFLGVEDGAFDARLAPVLGSALRQVEKYIGLSLSEQQWRLTLDRFDGDVIELPRGPVLSVEGVSYIDALGSAQTLDDAAYLLDAIGDPQSLVVAPGTAWPPTGSGYPNAVTIDFTAGYADDAAIEDIKLAIMQQVRAGFEQGAVALTKDVMDALRSYRRILL